MSGAQVSPTEIENTIFAHPDKLVADVCVAGVSGGRTSDEKLPRAWLVLSDEGKRRGPEETIKALDAWVKKNLSSYKWLRGGYETVDAVRRRSLAAHGAVMTNPAYIDTQKPYWKGLTSPAARRF